MEPMKPMKPMKPMEPMKPMAKPERWWADDLGDPSTSGGQNGMRYAFFPEQRRLVIEQEGKTTTYDTADHKISGVSQKHGGSTSLQFASQDGDIDLDELKQL